MPPPIDYDARFVEGCLITHEQNIRQHYDEILDPRHPSREIIDMNFVDDNQAEAYIYDDFAAKVLRLFGSTDSDRIIAGQRGMMFAQQTMSRFGDFDADIMAYVSEYSAALEQLDEVEQCKKIEEDLRKYCAKRGAVEELMQVYAVAIARGVEYDDTVAFFAAFGFMFIERAMVVQDAMSSLEDELGQQSR